MNRDHTRAQMLHSESPSQAQEPTPRRRGGSRMNRDHTRAQMLHSESLAQAQEPTPGPAEALA